MASHPLEEPLIPLRLRSREQWLLHHALGERLDAWRRAGERPPPEYVDTSRALGKLEAGSLLFTPEELLGMREALSYHRGRPDDQPAGQRATRALVERIDAALAERGSVARR